VKIEKSKLFFVIPKTISVIPYPYNFLASYPLSLKLFCQLSLIPKTPKIACEQAPEGASAEQTLGAKRRAAECLLNACSSRSLFAGYP